MRNALLPITLALALAACKGDSAKRAEPAAAATTPATAAKATDTASADDKASGLHLKTGEATVYELGTPELAVMKLHADGSVEMAWRTKTKEEWMAGGVVKPDGTIESNGEPVMTIAEGVTSLNDHGDTVTLTGDKFVFHFPGLADVTAALVDGKIRLTGDRHDGMGDRWRVDAADPAVARTAFLVYGRAIAAQID